MPVFVAGFVNQVLPVIDYPGRAVASARQGEWKTRRLGADEHISTGGLSACTALALFDPVAGVASVAHFDGGQAAMHVDTMLAEMLLNHASLGNIRAAISGWPAFNFSAQSVYNDLRVAASLIARYRTTVYDGDDMLAVFGDGRVGWWGPG